VCVCVCLVKAIGEVPRGFRITGVNTSEDDVTLTLGDEKGERHAIPKADIDDRTTQRRSTMPDGLEKRISDREFLDLLTFLSQEP